MRRGQILITALTREGTATSEYRFWTSLHIRCPWQTEKKKRRWAKHGPTWHWPRGGASGRHTCWSTTLPYFCYPIPALAAYLTDGLIFSQSTSCTTLLIWKQSSKLSASTTYITHPFHTVTIWGGSIESPRSLLQKQKHNTIIILKGAHSLSLMCTSFVSLSSDSNHLLCRGQPHICSSRRLVSFFMLSGKELMPSLYLITRVWRHVNLAN